MPAVQWRRGNVFFRIKTVKTVVALACQIREAQRLGIEAGHAHPDGMLNVALCVRPNPGRARLKACFSRSISGTSLGVRPHPGTAGRHVRCGGGK